MDWGIVASVVVAIAIFMVGIMAIGLPICLLMCGRMKRTTAAGGVPRCPMAGFLFRKDIEGSIKTDHSVV